MNGDKLRMLVIFNSLIGVIGGGSRHIVEVVNCWIPAHEITFLISKAGYDVAKEDIKPCAGKHVMVYSSLFDYSKNKYVVYLFRLLKSIILSIKLRHELYDVVIAPNFLPQNIVPTLFYKGKSKIVVYFHGGPPSLRTEQMRKRGCILKIISTVNWEFCVLFAKMYDVIFVVENSTKNYFIERGFNPQRVVVVGNGISYEDISKIEVNKKECEYDGVFLGRLVLFKVGELLDIWNEVVKKISGARLCIIGDGPARDELEIQANKYGLDVTFKGWVSGDDKYKLLKGSKVFVFPSYYESWGIVLAEAMACGLPVVAYNQPVYHDVFENCIIGINVGDIREMANQIIEVFNNYANYDLMLKKNMQIVSKYNWEAVANYQLKCIQTAIKNK